MLRLLSFSICICDSGQAAWALGARRACRQQAGRWACWRWTRRQGLRGVRAGRAGRPRQAGMRGSRGRGVQGAQASGTAWASGSLEGARAWAVVTRGRARSAHGYCSCDTAGPGCDTAGPRATIRPLCAPGCAQLGQIWVLCTLTRFFSRFDLLSHQMNTVLCEINFSNIYIYIYIYIY